MSAYFAAQKWERYTVHISPSLPWPLIHAPGSDQSEAEKTTLLLGLMLDSNPMGIRANPEERRRRSRYERLKVYVCPDSPALLLVNFLLQDISTNAREKMWSSLDELLDCRDIQRRVSMQRANAILATIPPNKNNIPTNESKPPIKSYNATNEIPTSKKNKASNEIPPSKNNKSLNERKPPIKSNNPPNEIPMNKNKNPTNETPTKKNNTPNEIPPSKSKNAPNEIPPSKKDNSLNESNKIFAGYNRQVLKAFLAGAVQPGDIVESICTGCKCYTKLPKRIVLGNVQGHPVGKCVEILRNAKNYPLEITFLRSVSNPSIVESKITAPISIRTPLKKRKGGVACQGVGQEHSMQKRSKTFLNSHSLPNLTLPKMSTPDNPICIIDSDSDGENDSMENVDLAEETGESLTISSPEKKRSIVHGENSCNETTCSFGDGDVINNDDIIVVSEMENSECLATTPMDSSVLPKSSPDPYPLFELEEVVLVQGVGPGRIISYWIERTSDWLQPVVFYTINVGFGRCYVPAERVKAQNFNQHVVLRYAGIEITKLDTLRLWPETYLNDSLVNFYLRYLQRDFFKNDTKRQQFTDSFHIFSTYFYSRMVLDNGVVAYKNVKKDRKDMWNEMKGWTKGVSIFKKRFLLIPVNYGLHWTFVLVCNPGDVIINCSSYSHTSSSDKAPGDKVPNKSPSDKSPSDKSPSGKAPSAKAPSDKAPSDKSPSDKAASDKSPSAKAPSDKSPNDKSPNDKQEPNEQPKPAPFNTSSCMIIFDSGKHLKIHKPMMIFSVIRKYLTAHWEAMPGSADMPKVMFNSKTMPGFSPPVPAQVNTKDCGVYMLEMIERIISKPPMVDSELIERLPFAHRNGGCYPFSSNWFSKKVVELKRVKMQGLIYELKEVNLV